MCVQPLVLDEDSDLLPLIFAEIRQTIAIRIIERIRGVCGVQGPIVSAMECLSNPTAILDFPTIGHSVTICIDIRRIDASVCTATSARIGPTRDVGCTSGLTFGLIAQVSTIEVMAGEIRPFEEEAPIFLTIEQAVAIRVCQLGICAVPSLFGCRDIAELVEIGPTSIKIFVFVGIEIDAIGIGIIIAIIGIGRVESKDELPTVGHAISIRIIRQWVNQDHVRIDAWIQGCEQQ